MTVIRQHARDFVERVCVRRILAEAHQKDGIFLSNAKVHSFLKRRFFFSNEIVVTDDVVYFHGTVVRLSEVLRSYQRQKINEFINQRRIPLPDRPA